MPIMQPCGLPGHPPVLEEVMRLLALLAPCASALLFDEAAKVGEQGGGGGDVRGGGTSLAAAPAFFVVAPIAH